MKTLWSIYKPVITVEIPKYGYKVIRRSRVMYFFITENIYLSSQILLEKQNQVYISCFDM